MKKKCIRGFQQQCEWSRKMDQWPAKCWLFCLAKLSFRIEEEIKCFPDRQKLKEFISIKPALWEILKSLFLSWGKLD